MTPLLWSGEAAGHRHDAPSLMKVANCRLGSRPTLQRGAPGWGHRGQIEALRKRRYVSFQGGSTSCRQPMVVPRAPCLSQRQSSLPMTIGPRRMRLGSVGNNWIVFFPARPGSAARWTMLMPDRDRVWTTSPRLVTTSGVFMRRVRLARLRSYGGSARSAEATTQPPDDAALNAAYRGSVW